MSEPRNPVTLIITIEADPHCTRLELEGIGGFLGAQADRDQFLYYTRTTQERVERSCIGEMEREVHEILKECGVDKVRFQCLPSFSLLSAFASHFLETE